MDVLRDKALAALEEVAAEALKEPVPKSLSLRFTLAFLSNFAEERWPFDEMWKAATEPKSYGHLEFGRHQSLNSALAGIYHQLGLKRPY
jgi:hypothetical protein